MKSIVAEASSISKAIEKALNDANNPQEFSIKVLETPQRNFLGFTIRSAKIALMFTEAKISKMTKGHKSQKSQYNNNINKSKITKRETPKAIIETKNISKPKAEENKPSIKPNNKPIKQQPIWSDSMVKKVTGWMKDTLKTINKDISFTVETSNYYLKLKFDRPVYSEQHRQKQLFASLATLMLSMLKRKYKRPLRGYKIILTSDKDV